MTTHWHGVTVGPANALGVVEPVVTGETDWDRDRAKHAMAATIRAEQGNMRFEDEPGQSVGAGGLVDRASAARVSSCGRGRGPCRGVSLHAWRL